MGNFLFQRLFFPLFFLSLWIFFFNPKIFFNELCTLCTQLRSSWLRWVSGRWPLHWWSKAPAVQAQ